MVIVTCFYFVCQFFFSDFKLCRFGRFKKYFRRRRSFRIDIFAWRVISEIDNPSKIVLSDVMFFNEMTELSHIATHKVVVFFCLFTLFHLFLYYGRKYKKQTCLNIGAAKVVNILGFV